MYFFSLRTVHTRLLLSSLLLSLFCLRAYYGLSVNIPIETILAIDKVLLVLPICMLAPLLRRHLSFSIIFNVTVLCFSIVYAIQRLLLGIPRPELFTESNIELALPLVLYFVVFKQIKLFWHFLFAATLIISGSVSGVATFISIIFLIKLAHPINVLFNRIKDLRIPGNKALFFISALVFLSCISFVIFRLRGYTSLYSIDRIQWFLASFSGKTLMTSFNFSFLYQNVPAAACIPWKQTIPGNIFSCFSPSLNSQFSRYIFDYGLIFGLLIYPLFYCILRSRALPQYYSRGLTMIGFLNGLSVSGLQNSFFLIGVLLCISFQRSLPINNSATF